MGQGIMAAMWKPANVRRAALALAVTSLAAVALPGKGHAADGFSTFSVNALANATIRSSVGVNSVTIQATGVYKVTFNHNIAPACSFTASPLATTPSFAIPFYSASFSNSIIVRTFNKTGVATALGFSLIVTCGP
jgi:hypothetical protein